MSARRRVNSAKAENRQVEARLRVIGGTLRGRTIHYNGDPHLRPMKDRVREAVFNLIGPRIVKKHVLDLFAGTGAMSFEALSRGADRATLIERRFPNVDQLKVTAAELDLADRIEVTAGDTFIWGSRIPLQSEVPWVIFCCPPYELYQTRFGDLVELIKQLWKRAPADSVLVIESDSRCDPAGMLENVEWDVRTYAPAVVGIAQKTN